MTCIGTISWFITSFHHILFLVYLARIVHTNQILATTDFSSKRKTRGVFFSVGFLSIYVGDAKLIRLFLLNKLEERHKLKHTQALEDLNIFDFQSKFFVSNYWYDFSTVMSHPLKTSEYFQLPMLQDVRR